MGDTGLLCAACMKNIQFDILMGNVDVNMGSILENVMAQELKCNGFELYYYDSKKQGEVDFVIQNRLQADLIEVKSGSDFKKHNTINKMIETPGWRFGKAYVFCRGNIEQCEKIIYLPWYMVMFYRQEELMQSQIYKIDLSALEKI